MSRVSGATRSTSPVRGWSVGQLVTSFRRRRGLSQLALALDAGLSARHVSFIESGRSQPSEAALAALASALGLPSRLRARLFEAGGYRTPPVLAADEQRELERSFEALLHAHPAQLAMAKDAGWRLVAFSPSARTLLDRLLEPPARERSLSALDLILGPEGLRRSLRNWPELAGELLLRAKHELSTSPNPALEESLRRVLAYPELRAIWERLEVGREPGLRLDYVFDLREGELRLRSLLLTPGPAYDPTLRGFRLDVFVPADPASGAVLSAVLGA